MKRTALAAAIASACGTVSAVPLSTPPTIEIVSAGATAFEQTLRDAVIDNLCASDIDEYRIDASAGNHFLVTCNMVNGIGGSSADVLYFHKNNQGSSTGAVNIATDDPVQVIDQASCTPGASTPQTTPAGTSYDRASCSAGTQVKTLAPDMGTSDTEPPLFRGPLAQRNFGSFPDGAPIDARATVDLGFGINVTTKLRNALAAVQFPLGAKCNPLATTEALAAGATDADTNGVNDAFEALLPDQPFLADPGSPPLYGETPDDNGWVDEPHRVGDSRECMPSLALSEVRGLLRGDFTGWDQFKLQNPVNGGADLYAAAVGTPWQADDPIFALCRRENGSGTHATISSALLDTNCKGPASSSMVEGSAVARTADDDNSDGALDGFRFAANFGAWEAAGSSELGQCLDDIERARTGSDSTFFVPVFGFDYEEAVLFENNIPKKQLWAMGYQSVEKNPDLEEGYRFVKIDGQSPDLANIIEGDYWVFSSTAWSRDGAGSYENIPGGKIPVADGVFETLAAALSEASLVRPTVFRHPYGLAGISATVDGGTEVFQSYPYVPGPTPTDPLPISSQTHVGPQGLSMCFGPVMRDRGDATTAADNPNAE